MTFALCLLTFTARPFGERFGYAPEEFTARRERLVAALGSESASGTLVLFGKSAAAPGLRFRQDHDFYYLTGNEALNAVLVMDVGSGAAHLFMPKLSAREIQYEGGNWLEERTAAETYGFASIQPLENLQAFLAARAAPPPGRPAAAHTLWLRLSPPDDINASRGETATRTAARLKNPLAQHPTEDAARADALRAALPGADVRDVTPRLDRLRLIKSPREIEILRYAARISAEAMRRAIQATAPGRFEYELAAEATYWLFKHGMQAAAYPAIVGSGPMGNQWHYEDNGRRMNAGELVVMDYAGSLDYLTTDITRTWPVSGRFTTRQRQAYEATLDAQQALIRAIKPGVPRLAVRRIAEDVMRAHGFDPRYAYFGHYVGLSVHDVGDWNLPFEPGMALAIEPIIDIPEEGLHIRIEDTVLVTPAGAEVLSAAVPKDVDGLLALLNR